MTQPETRIQRAVQALCRERGAFVWKVHGNKYTMTGLPDIVGTYIGQFIAFETKTAAGKLSEVQKYRIQAIRRAGGLVVAPCTTTAEALELFTLYDRVNASGEYADLRALSERFGRTAVL